MANYYAKTRTNYFKVKDEDAFRNFVSRMVGTECKVVLIEDKTENGKVFGFYCESALSGLRPEKDEVGNNTDDADEEDEYGEGEDGMDLILDGLSELVADDDAVILTEVGNEAMRYLVGYATIVTNKGIESVSLSGEAKKRARGMLRNEEWETKNEY